MTKNNGTTEIRNEDKDPGVQDSVDSCPVQSGHPLPVIRKRRRLLFATVLLYIPLLIAVHAIWPTHMAMGTYFAIWLAALISFTVYSALLRCPNCGNFFHMHGMTLLYLRKCLHCQLHVNSDKLPATKE